MSCKVKEKDNASQSTTCVRKARVTQVINQVEGSKQNTFSEYVHRAPNEKSKVHHEHVLKHEVEQDNEEEEFVEQEAIEVEDYVLDYECSEYLSPDMVVCDVNSPVEGYDDSSFTEKIEYKIEVPDSKFEELDMLDIGEGDAYSIVEPAKPIKPKRSKKSTETCNICKIEVKSNAIKSHRNLHQQTLPMILDSIPYFRCGRCKTVFAEISHMESHYVNGNCCSYVDEPICTDYQYLEDFPECDTEEGGPFSGCRTLRLSSVQTTDETFNCELCYDFSSSNVDDILDHSVKHFSNDKENNVVYYDEIMPGPHRCGVCQLNQPSLSAALRHVYFHLTTFVCPIKDCDENFAEFKSLSGHIEQRHMAKENVKHQRCMHCGEISNSYQAFRQHQRKECEKKIYRCDVCGTIILFH